MMRVPTTDAMVADAQTAYDESAAEAVRVVRQLRAAVESKRFDLVEALAAESFIAIAQREYAWAVYVSAERDYRADLRSVGSVSA